MKQAGSQVFSLSIYFFAAEDVIVKLGNEIASILDYRERWMIAESERYIADDLRKQWKYENPSKAISNEVSRQITFNFPSAKLSQAATETAREYLEGLESNVSHSIIVWLTVTDVN
ncbi:MAG: hypothetical protein Q4A92_11340 [Corynebacterium sp.]|nr:hypothetical protein [Corynebacterium sp.]